MAEETEGGLTFGTHNKEIPKVYPIKKDGTKKQINGKDFFFGVSKIKEVKLAEGIEEFCVTGYVRFFDDGINRIATLMRDGYDYLEIEFFSNYFKDTKKVRFEIVNIEGIEEGRLINGYDMITLYIAQYPSYRNLQVWKFSKGYKNKKISDIVNDIFDNFLNKENQYKKENEKGSTIENTDKPLESFCNPFWSPYQTLNYLKKFAKTGNSAGFFCYFDMNKIFNFRSLRHIMKNGAEWELELNDIRNLSLAEAAQESKPFIRDYYMNFVQKQYHKIGLSGATAERFNWFKKKQYTHKRGYLQRPLPQGPNIIFESPEDINNMFGYHMFTGYRWDGDSEFTKALVYNRLLTAIAAQSRTYVLINGIIKIKPGDTVKVKNKVQGVNANIEELGGSWFVRGIDHTWTQTKPYTQKLHLSRIGAFVHLGP
jgi:hypothetical protein